MPAIQAARGLAPIAEKCRPIVVLRKTISRMIASAATTQTEKLMPRKRASPQAAIPGGTRASCGSATRYHKVAPVVIAPTASVTIRALSSNTAIKMPLINPISVANNSAPHTAANRASSWPPEKPSTIVLDSVITAGIDRSMPRAMSTSVSPIAVMARNAASGMIARNVDGSRLRGATMAQKTTSPSIAIQIAANRIRTRHPAYRRRGSRPGR